MKYFAIAFLAALVVSAQDRSVPVDNEFVRVLKVTQAPHNKTSLHEHKMNRVMIYLQPGKQTIEYQGGKPAAHLNWKAGEALWSPQAGMHIAEITSAIPVTIVELELKNAGGKVTRPAMDVLKDPKHYKLEFENDQVRVMRGKAGPKETIPMHEHGLKRVGVYLTDQDFKVTTADGKATMVTHKAGDVGWSTPGTHKEENLSDKPFEILMIEIK